MPGQAESLFVACLCCITPSRPSRWAAPWCGSVLGTAREVWWPAICHALPSFTPCHLPSAICHLPSAICHLPSPLPLQVVKLGTITPHGADVYSYAPGAGRLPLGTVSCCAMLCCARPPSCTAGCICAGDAGASGQQLAGAAGVSWQQFGGRGSGVVAWCARELAAGAAIQLLFRALLNCR